MRQAQCEIGHERSERFDYIPAQIIRREITHAALSVAAGVFRPGSSAGGRGRCDLRVPPRPGQGIALKLLGHEFTAYLQRDGYGVYGSIARERPEILAMGCWSHVRRKFIDAKDDERELARRFELEIRKLYRIEARARDKA